tara:strand:- start:200 stop:433 length:234 start_codon:yes stop_codon:yes gene_type:complete
MNTVILVMLTIIATILLGRFILMEGHRIEERKKFHKNIKRMDLEERIKKEINSISPLFNSMTGLEVREMMEKKAKNK